MAVRQVQECNQTAVKTVSGAKPHKKPRTPAPQKTAPEKMMGDIFPAQEALEAWLHEAARGPHLWDKGSGAPPGNRNAMTHGAFNSRVRAIKAQGRALAASMRRALAHEDEEL